jgi:sugar-specific transcriptional regulator TrmB
MAFRYLPPEKLEKARRKHFDSKLRSYKKHLNKQKDKNPYYKIRQNLNLVRMNNRIGSHRNTLRWSSAETKAHILKKLEICMELKEWGHEFLTEAIFKNGARCDVLDLTEGTIYEILNTETDELLEEKVKTYPKELQVIKIKC